MMKVWSLFFVFLFAPCASGDWHDTFYQYRVPIVVESKRSGWSVVNITATQITQAINACEEMVYDSLWFDYNRLKVIEMGADGQNRERVDAGFYLVPVSEELVDPVAVARTEQLEIPTERGGYYLLSYLSKGAGSSPASGYDQTFGLGHELRRDAYRSSYEPKLLPKAMQKNERLLLSDGSPLRLDVRSQVVSGPADLGSTERFVAGVKDLSVKRVEMKFLAEFQIPGEKQWLLYYQPVNGHNLVVPRKRYHQIPGTVVHATRITDAEKFLGQTAYRLISNDQVTAWFAETTVKLTPNTSPPSPTRPGVRISCAANESQSFQLVLRPNNDWGFQKVVATALRGLQSSIESSEVTFYVADYVPIHRGSYITPVHYHGHIADALVSVSPMVLAPRKGNHVLWVTVRVPAGTRAGTYEGGLAIHSDGMSPIEIPLAVEVYDFELPEFSPFRSSWGGSHITKAYQDKRVPADFHGLSSKQEIKKLARHYYDVMAQNKFTPHNVAQYSEIGMDWSPPPEGYNHDKPGNYFKLYDWDFTELNRDLEHYIDDLKVNAFTLVHTNPSVLHMFKHLPGAQRDAYFRDPGHVSLAWQTFRQNTKVGYELASEDGSTEYRDIIEISRNQYDRLLLDFYGAIARNLDQHGWLDHACILVDETAYRGYGEFLHFLRLLKSDPYTARIKVMWTMQGPSGFNHKENPDDEGYAFNELLDIYIPEAQENYQWWEKHYFSDYDVKPVREKLWTYVTHTTRVAIDTPGVNNRAFGLEIFNYGGGGYLCWASFMWAAHTGSDIDNPWEDPWTRWANGAMSFFYPPCKEGVSPLPDFTIIPSLRVMAYREGVDDFEYAYLLENLAEEAAAKGVNTAEAETVLNDIKRFFYSTVHWSQNDAWYLELRDRIARRIVALKKDLKD